MEIPFFNKQEISALALNHLHQGQSLHHLLHWMLENEESYGIHKKDLFKEGLLALDEKLDTQHSQVKKLLKDLER